MRGPRGMRETGGAGPSRTGRARGDSAGAGYTSAPGRLGDQTGAEAGGAHAWRAPDRTDRVGPVGVWG
ncbi:hypothetical protein GCM10023324_60530 [Streptomyces youssoufiensis]